MPDTPIYGITYPCLADDVTLADFATFASDVEAAIATVDAEAALTLRTPNAIQAASTATAVGVEAVMTFSVGPNSSTANGLTVNSGAGTVTVITPGVYKIGAFVSPGNQSTLTMTSQRIAIYINGVFYAARKYRGRNPASFDVLGGAFDTAVFLAAGSVVTLRYLWTGTGALNGVAGGELSMQLLATP